MMYKFFSNANDLKTKTHSYNYKSFTKDKTNITHHNQAQHLK